MYSRLSEEVKRRSSLSTHTRDSSAVGLHRGLISLVLDEIIGPPEKSGKTGRRQRSVKVAVKAAGGTRGCLGTADNGPT